ncbi:MAG: radical SAM protein [Treponema sp.]|jgi:MoaA/NifB/PqqE/SkfB family radical SAM enzyme|nr:radical SAM protein [Treponema sp.]
MSRILRNQHTVQQNIKYLEVSVTDHCNLNCKYCGNFSPLAPEKYIDIDIFDRDCARLSSLAKGNIKAIRLLGGEPLLHPRLIEVLDIARKHFTLSRIELVTNGLLLLKMTEPFWEKCQINTIHVSISHYPIKLNYSKIKAIAKSYNVKTDYGNFAQPMYKWLLDVKGTQNIEKSHSHCARANMCVTLREGKLYVCSLIPYVQYFNEYFNQKMNITEEDCIDLYQVNTFEEILRYLGKPVLFCKHCDTGKIVYCNDWGISKREITEWTR